MEILIEHFVDFADDPNFASHHRLCKDCLLIFFGSSESPKNHFHIKMNIFGTAKSKNHSCVQIQTLSKTVGSTTTKLYPVK